jgi:hypothetical protein
MKQPKVDAKTRKLIERAIADHRDGHDIRITHLLAEIDDEGVEGISLGLTYGLSRHPVDPRKSLELRSAISDALARIGDLRHVYIFKKFDDQQEIKVVQRAS